MARSALQVCLVSVLMLGVPVLGRSDVLVLGDADFDYLAVEQETMLVQFYAPWCGHCKKLAPEFEVAATRLKGTVSFAKVDCTANSETCGRFGVTGYPTLRIFRNGDDSSSYDGPRSADGIVSHMRKQAGPNSRLLLTEEELQAFIRHSGGGVVGFFAGSASTLLAEFLKAASLMRETCRFGHTPTCTWASRTEAVLLFRPPLMASRFEESVVLMREPLSITAIRRFLRDNLFGICPHLTKENKARLQERDLLTAYYDVDYEHNPKGSNYWRNRVMKVAARVHTKGLQFSVANRQDFLDELEKDFGLGMPDSGDLPFVTIRTRAGHKYSMREEFTRDGSSLERFLEQYSAGQLKRYIKSEPVPPSNTGPVKVVVADSFVEIVNDPEKDVLIEFYAPWCAHCKKLEPKYMELAEELSSNPNVVIAKMDATANDVPPGYDVLGFPSIYLAKAGRKDQPKRYEGAREVKDLLSFVKREASHRGSQDEL